MASSIEIERPPRVGCEPLAERTDRAAKPPIGLIFVSTPCLPTGPARGRVSHYDPPAPPASRVRRNKCSSLKANIRLILVRCIPPVSEPVPHYQSGEEVRCGDRVSYNRQLGRIGFVAVRQEYAPDFPASEWSDHSGFMICFDNGARLQLDEADELLSLLARHS